MECRQRHTYVGIIVYAMNSENMHSREQACLFYMERWIVILYTKGRAILSGSVEPNTHHYTRIMSRQFCGRLSIYIPLSLYGIVQHPFYTPHEKFTFIVLHHRIPCNSDTACRPYRRIYKNVIIHVEPIKHRPIDGQTAIISLGIRTKQLQI